ncbi:hypothetical protein ACOMHN_040492 [Nucella lapillus]
MTPSSSPQLLFLTSPNPHYLHLHPDFTPTITTDTNHSLNDSRGGEEDGGGGRGGGVGDGRGGVWMGKVVYLSVLSVLVVAGNVLVVASIVLLRSMHRVTHYFLLSLATADLLVGVVTIPLFILWLVNQHVFRHGLSCNAVLLSCLFVMAASQLNVVAVTVERYMAVCHPFYHRRVLLSKPGRVMLVIAALWAVSFLSTALSSLAIESDNRECRYYGYFNRWFLLVVVIVGAFLPFTLILVLNLQMLMQIRSSRVFKQEMYQPAREGGRRRLSRASGGLGKATSMVMTVCLLFLLAWTPFFIVILIHSFCPACRLTHALDLILLFAFTNSACNPLLYALCNLQFRSAYAQIVTMCCCPLPHSPLPATPSISSGGGGRRESVFLLLQGRQKAGKRASGP